MVEATYDPGVTVGLVARLNGVQPDQLFAWRGWRQGRAHGDKRP